MTSEYPIVFYDGDCGLCHGWVLFVIKHDPAGKVRFAPLQTATLELDEPTLSTVVVQKPSGEFLVRSTAVLYILQELGGSWGMLSKWASIVPTPLRDLVYRMVARVRTLLFAKPKGLCPIVPPELRERFLQ